jgi:DNA ligase D-like protein (predicted 3'-phosphoesterase)
MATACLGTRVGMAPTKNGSLREYRAKRNTRSSGEPSGRSRRRRQQNLFVVQRHDASSLHFDFRLRIGDVLASWAVPKGPSLNPRDKRLAARTEDHPLDYADFEGQIAAGEYGAGTVVVWDMGTYENLLRDDEGREVSMSDGLDSGHLKFALDGQKLSGGFALTQTKMRGDARNWLLVKLDDEGADRRRRPATTQPESVLSGKTNEDLEDAAS